MTTWSDDFSHDYFSDATYDLLAGVEGVDFSVTSTLNLLTGGSPVQWIDPRVVTDIGWVQVTFADAADLAASTAGGNLNIGLNDPTAGVQLYMELDTFGGYFFWGPGGDFIDSGSVAIPASGPLAIRVTITSGDITVSVPGDSATAAIPSGDEAALAAASPSPWVWMNLAVTADIPLAEWSYDTGSPSDAITVVAVPDSIMADGLSTSVVTATVLDGGGVPLVGETVVFTAPDGAFGLVTDHGDGTYSSVYVSDMTPTTVVVTATDGSISATCDIDQLAAAQGNITAGTPQTGVVH